MRKKAFLVFFFTWAGCTTNAMAATECHIRIVGSVTDNLNNHWKKGQVVPVDIQRTKANHITYCAHGGSCFPATTHQRKASNLIDCRPGKKIDEEDRILVPLRSKER